MWTELLEAPEFPKNYAIPSGVAPHTNSWFFLKLQRWRLQTIAGSWEPRDSYTNHLDSQSVGPCVTMVLVGKKVSG